MLEPSLAAASPTPPPGAAVTHDALGRRLEYLRVSVTDRCNYRCTYCMPEAGLPTASVHEQMSPAEMVELVRVFVRLGVRRLRLTGGEPTVRRDLLDIVTRLRAIEELDDIALSTNGQRLDELAAPLRRAGVSRLSVSLDSLDSARFAQITRRGQLACVVAGLEAAREAGYSSIKLNTVAVKGWNDGELAALCTFAWERGFLPRFIEQMPLSGGSLFVPGQFLAAAEIRATLAKAFGEPLQPDDSARPRGAGPARYWRVGDAVEGSPRVLGIISAVSEPFCDTCNRVRLTARGALHGCLAHDQAVDLRAALAAGGPEAVERAVRAALAAKPARHLFTLGGQGGPRKSMLMMGG